MECVIALIHAGADINAKNVSLTLKIIFEDEEVCECEHMREIENGIDSEILREERKCK